MTADPQPVPDAALTAALGGYYGHPTAITAADPDVIDGLTAGLAAGMAAIRKDERDTVADEIIATRDLWSSQAPEGPNGCVDADTHNCHRVAGEWTFTMAAMIAREPE